MAVSELHNRLEHLVTYSSQLIFVSGSSLGQQQQALEAFLSRQSENTELAFLNGEPHQALQTYRKQIHKQLLGDDSGLFNRPLNELLAPLNHHEGPVLICICQAEHLPQSFLQELWELVLQSRFAENKQHLNVLLFGQPQWAEQAKAWLPDNNRERPLLLSTESIHAHSEAGPPPSELDQLIARKRAAFAKRLEARHHAPEPAKPLLASRAFRVFIASVFIVLFSAILSWQYQSEILAWLQSPEGDHATVTEEMSKAAPIEVNTPPSDALPQQPTAQSDSENAPATPDLPAEQSSTTQENTSDEILVTDWQSAVEAIRLPGEAIEAPERQGASPSSEFKDANDVAASQSTQPTEQAGTSELVALEDMNPVEDFQVEDIVSVEQLPPVAETPAQPPNIGGGVTAENPEPQSEPQRLSAEIAFHEGEIEALPPAEFVIQIAGLSDMSVLQDYLADNRLAGDTWLYRTERYGGTWYVLLVNQSFGTLQQARAAIDALPPNLRQGVPFAKSVAQAQQEISQSLNQ